MQKPALSLPYVTRDPLQISVNRGGACESVHLVDLVVCDADGQVILAMGETERVIFPRSAMKPLQAIALVEMLNAAADLPEFTPAEIALICASHNGEDIHVEAVKTLLAKYDLQQDCLSCGPHWSLDQSVLIKQVRALDKPQTAHNNCSGKHAGMAILAQLLTGSSADYARLSHAAQQRILGVLEFMTGTDLTAYSHGIDGCGAPVYSGPLGNWARAFALFAGGGEMPEARTEACTRIKNSIAAEPHYIAGENRACTAINAAYGEAITVKTGAEGVFSAAFHELGLGAMLKARDGNKRGAEVALGAVIRALGYAAPPSLAPYFTPLVYNWAGDVVGDITMPNLPF